MQHGKEKSTNPTGASSARTPSTRTDDKPHILRDFRRFFRQGLQYRHFTRRLYEHLTRHCGFVVRRGRRGFYETYIEDPDVAAGILGGVAAVKVIGLTVAMGVAAWIVTAVATYQKVDEALSKLRT